MSLRTDIYALEEACRNPRMNKSMLIASLCRIVDADRERQADKAKPRIKVPKGAAFMVDLANGIACDTFTLGPVHVFFGREALEVVAKAQAAGGYAANDAALSRGPNAADPEFLSEQWVKLATDSDLVSTDDWHHVAGYVVAFVGDVDRHYNARFVDAMLAVADDFMVDVSRQMACFLRDGTVVGYVMGVRS